MDLNSLIEKLSRDFNTTEKGKQYNDELANLNAEHDSLSEQVNKLSQKKRANRRKQKSLESRIESDRNDYIVEEMTKVSNQQANQQKQESEPTQSNANPFE